LDDGYTFSYRCLKSGIEPDIARQAVFLALGGRIKIFTKGPDSLKMNIFEFFSIGNLFGQKGVAMTRQTTDYLGHLGDDKKLFMRIVAGNMQLAVCRTARSLDPEDTLVLLGICRKLVIEGNGKTRESEIERMIRLFSGVHGNKTIRELQSSRHTLIKEVYIELVGNGIMDGAEFSLTKKTEMICLTASKFTNVKVKTKKILCVGETYRRKSFFIIQTRPKRLRNLPRCSKPNLLMKFAGGLRSAGAEPFFPAFFTDRREPARRNRCIKLPERQNAILCR
jgi:hypothetical protein